MNHRILPPEAGPGAPNQDPHAPPTTRHSPSRFTLLAIYLFLIVFAFFSFFIMASHLSPFLVTGRATNVTTITLVNVTPSPIFLCNDTLPAGTSLTSLPCLPLLVTRDELFANLSAHGANVLAMYQYTPWTNGKWHAYNSSLPSYVVQSLTEVTRQEGVYFIMNAPETFSYSGALPHNTNIPLHQGWNLAGYPSNLTQPLTTSLASINNTYTEIKTLEGTEESGQYLVSYNPGGGNLTNTSVYHGYWINMTAPDTWVVTS
jgi:hypothetical protein